jgi:hypothetical protein
MSNMFGLGPADPYYQGMCHLYETMDPGVVMEPPVQMSREEQAQAVRAYNEKLLMEQAAAYQRMMGQAAGSSNAPMGSPRTTADGGDWLMAESVVSDAEKHKEPEKTPPGLDPMEAHRNWAHNHMQTLMSGGYTQAQAMMDAMAQAQKTESPEIIAAVSKACEELPVDATQ